MTIVASLQKLNSGENAGSFSNFYENCPDFSDLARKLIVQVVEKTLQNPYDGLECNAKIIRQFSLREEFLWHITFVTRDLL